MFLIIRDYKLEHLCEQIEYLEKSNDLLRCEIDFLRKQEQDLINTMRTYTELKEFADEKDEENRVCKTVMETLSFYPKE